jgi:N-ethylmaleimide reductase
MSKLIMTPFTLGSIQLQNRVVMAPMTRSRALLNQPNDIMADYYRQRSSAGLIITEGTSPSKNGLGYARIPGLFNEQHVEGWRKVTSAVHARGSKIFVQVMHTGRVGHMLNMPGGQILAPSAVALPGQHWTDSAGMQDLPTPKAMTASDVSATIDEYSKCAELAIAAGFDGIELHAANGYLIDQFLNPKSNIRTDAFGIDKKKFAVEVAQACAAKIGAERIGMRLSPYGTFNDLEGAFDGVDDLYGSLAKDMNNIGLVYLHLISRNDAHSAVKKIKDNYKGTIILSQGYDAAKAESDLLAKECDLVAFGKAFISNPNLPEKMDKGLPLTTFDESTFYTADAKGYTDYI